MKKHKLTDIPGFHKTPLVLAVLAALPGVAVPEAFADCPPLPPVGPEFQVNTTTADRQLAPAMAMDAQGNFVVVWQSYGQEGDRPSSERFGVYAQRYNAAGVPQESGDPPKCGEFQVNTTIDDDQKAPAVAMDATGDFVVVWESGAQDGSGFGVYAQRYNAAGAPLGSEFPVNTTTTGRQWHPAVAMDAAGDFVVTWESKGQDGDGYGIYARRYDKTGKALTPEFQVNTTTDGDQINPAVAMDASGNFVVVWLNEEGSHSSYSIHARRYDAAGVPAPECYDAAGNPQGSECQVTGPLSATDLHRPAVAMDAARNFVVVWPETAAHNIYARRYTFTTGAPQAQGSEFQVNTISGGSPSPALAMNADGNFVVAWGRSLGELSWDIYARRYDKTGMPQGPEFRVNTYPAGDDDDWHLTAMAMNAAGDFKIVWQSFDGDNGGIAGQRYALNNCNAAFPPLTPADVSNKVWSHTVVPGGPAGTFSFIATFCNHGAIPLSDLVSRTIIIGPPPVGISPNHLLNRHYGPKPAGMPPSELGLVPTSEVGSVLDFPADNLPPLNNGYNDHVLAVKECVDVTYKIGLAQWKPFSFWVDIYGRDATLQGGSVTGTPCR